MQASLSDAGDTSASGFLARSTEDYELGRSLSLSLS